MRTWCNHIDPDPINPFLWEVVLCGKQTQVPESWKLCPICGSKRPKAKKARRK